VRFTVTHFSEGWVGQNGTGGASGSGSGGSGGASGTAGQANTGGVANSEGAAGIGGSSNQEVGFPYATCRASNGNISAPSGLYINKVSECVYGLASSPDGIHPDQIASVTNSVSPLSVVPRDPTHVNGWDWAQGTNGQVLVTLYGQSTCPADSLSLGVCSAGNTIVPSSLILR